MLAIKNATLVMLDHYIPDATLLLDNGEIVDFGKKINIPADAEVIDAEGNYVGPGLIEIHTHAAGQYRFRENAKKCEEWLFLHGVTSVMPALYFKMNTEEYLDAMRRIDTAVDAGEFRNFAGYYMEGPYLNPNYGSNKQNNPWRGDIKKEEFAPIVDMAGERAKVWAVAPERENILEFVKYAKSVNPTAVFAVGHSEAAPEMTEELMPYGLKLGTHHTNATGTLETFPECRGACVDETVNYNNDIYAELICDSIGVHVHPYNLRLISQIKGKERIILIADADLPEGPPIPGCEDAHDLIFDFHGDIAGTQLTLDVSCRNMMMHTGCSICDAFRYASANPAKAVGFSKLGRIKKGNTANIIIVDDKFNVKKTIFEGQIV